MPLNSTANNHKQLRITRKQKSLNLEGPDLYSWDAGSNLCKGTSRPAY